MISGGRRRRPPPVTLSILNQKKTKKIKLKKFDYLITRPNEIHAYKFLEKTEMIVFSKGLRGGKDYEKDTFRVQKKLI